MIALRDLGHSYGKQGTVALEAVDLFITQGEYTCLRGPSGCGKSTLLMALGGLQRPSQGSVQVVGQDIYALDHAERAAFRARHTGFVFQMFHLVPYLDITSNLLLAGGRASQKTRRDALDHLELFGLDHRATHKPEELSAGEKQRAATARALFHKPSLLLADEPTGNLDPENADRVLDMFDAFHREGGTIVLVTHGDRAAERATRQLALDKGRLVS